MQHKGLAFLVNLIILVAGVLVIAAARRVDAVHNIIFITGVAFLVSAIINIFILSSGRDKEKRPGAVSRAMGWISSVAGVILGLAMVVFPESFRPIFIYVFAISLFIGGVYHIYMMASGLHPVKFPLWAFIAPLLLLIAGVTLFFVGSLRDASGQNTALLVTGGGMIVFVITTVIESIISGNAHRQLKREAKRAAEGQTSPATVDKDHQIEDVKPEDVTDLTKK